MQIIGLGRLRAASVSLSTANALVSFILFIFLIYLLLVNLVDSVGAMGPVMFPSALLTLALVSGVRSLTVTIPQTTYEHARGDNITLPCTFRSKNPNPSLIIVTWTALKVKAETEDTVISTFYSHTGRTDYTSKYDGRAKLDVKKATGEANLRLYSITMDENREFECRVQIPGDDEGTPADSTKMVVLVAPSTPICKIEGKTEYGQDIKLTCHSEEGSPTPTYKWESRDVRNMPRMKDPKTTDVGGVLSLFNISKETSGYYICTSSNKIRSATCNITLAVMPPSMLGSVGQTAGIVAGVVGALLILIIVIYCCCCKKKKKDEEYAMGVREEEYHDKEPTENGDRREIRDDNRDERDQRGYDDRRSDYDDPRSDYDDPRSDYDDRHSDYDDRRSDYIERRNDYTERRDRYDDDRRDRRYDDDRDRRDRRYDDDRHYDEAYDDRPPVPNSKPPKRDYDD